MSPDKLNIVDKNSQISLELGNFVTEKIISDQFSGTILVTSSKNIIYENASGLANKEQNVPNNIDTKFNLGSATKMYTGVAIAQLVEQGKLEFQQTVGQYLTDYPHKITIHQLLTHTAGLGSFIDTQYKDQFLSARKNLTTIKDVVALFQDRPLSYPTGEVHYSSDGYELLGLIIEAVSGLSYFDYIQKNIYDVANMSDSGSFETNVAIGYTNRDSAQRTANTDINFINGTSGGSSYSTCPDLLNFTQALLENKLLSPEMTQLVLSPKVKEGSKGNQTKYQGYGFQIFDINGVKRVGHPGRFAGVNTRIDMYPDLGYTAIVLSNYDPPSAFDIAEKAGELIIHT